jgi:hypothetical protein
MTLILWKAPVVDDPDEAAKPLRQLRRFPDADEGPSADGPPEPTEKARSARLLRRITVRPRTA